MTIRNDPRAAATTQSLLRTVNDRLLDLQRRLAGASLLEFVCECVHSDCQSSLTLTAEEYEIVRSGRSRFAVKHGHEVLTLERVAVVGEHAVIVEKTGAGRAVATRLAPRRIGHALVATAEPANHAGHSARALS